MLKPVRLFMLVLHMNTCGAVRVKACMLMPLHWLMRFIPMTVHKLWKCLLIHKRMGYIAVNIVLFILMVRSDGLQIELCQFMMRLVISTVLLAVPLTSLSKKKAKLNARSYRNRSFGCRQLQWQSYQHHLFLSVMMCW